MCWINPPTSLSVAPSQMPRQSAVTIPTVGRHQGLVGSLGTGVRLTEATFDGAS